MFLVSLMPPSSVCLLKISGPQTQMLKLDDVVGILDRISQRTSLTEHRPTLWFDFETDGKKPNCDV